MAANKLPDFGIVAMVALGLGGVMTQTAVAAYVVTMSQEGADVVATGSGSIDLTDLTYVVTNLDSSFIHPSLAIIAVGPTASTVAEACSTALGPSDFGSGGYSAPSSGSGSLVELSGDSGFLFVPSGYVSDASPRTSTDTWDNATLASLGVTPGSYTWTWGGGPDADSFTIDAPQPHPNPPLLRCFCPACSGSG